MKLTIGWLYPDLMSIYGDRGNVITLAKRCRWRKINIEVRQLSIENKVSEIEKCDLLFMGGAQDRQQKIAAEDLRKEKGSVIKEMVEEGIPGLFVCGAYQFLGHFYRPAEGKEIPGLGIFDLHTIHPGKDMPRCIGNIVVSLSPLITQLLDYSITTLVGFENHGGRTYLGKKVKPLGKVIIGFGNNGEDKTEGCVYKNAIGTYLHGPILPKNPHLADHLLRLALERKYQSEIKLEPLDDSLERKAHQFMLQKLGVRDD